MRALRPRQPVPNQDDERAAYAAGLRLLGGRELSRAQLGERLARRGFSANAATAAVERLTANGAVNDLRVALMHARAAAARHRGRDRATREMQRLGLAAAVVGQAVDEVFGALDEHALLEGALARRLRSACIESPAEFRHLYAFLVRQGFEPGEVVAVLRARSRGAKAVPHEED
jgi:regulatory protein